MRFRIDCKISNGPWKPQCVTVDEAYTTIEQLLSFLAWFRYQSGHDYRATRLWTATAVRDAEEECKLGRFHEVH
jgi:hypothetical protein